LLAAQLRHILSRLTSISNMPQWIKAFADGRRALPGLQTMLEFIATSLTAVLCLALLRSGMRSSHRNVQKLRLPLLVSSITIAILLSALMLGLSLWSNYVIFDDRVFHLVLGAVFGALGSDWLLHAQPQHSIRSTRDRLFYDAWALFVLVPLVLWLFLSFGFFSYFDRITRPSLSAVSTQNTLILREFASQPITDAADRGFWYAEGIHDFILRDRKYLTALATHIDPSYTTSMQNEIAFFETYYQPTLACLQERATSKLLTEGD
jgi:hypothetical protein